MHKGGVQQGRGQGPNFIMQDGKLLEMTAAGQDGGGQSCFMQTNYWEHCVLGELQEICLVNRNRSCDKNM